MPNQLTSTGLQTATYSELISNFTTAMQSIYGSSINLNSNTPDGQMMNIFIQSVVDLEELLTNVYNSFDPDQAFGTTLDQRVSINGIQRQAGTYTITNVTITTTQALNLYGLDQTAQPVFTVSDNAGNQWQLITTVSIPGASANVLSFQSSVPGAVISIPNTITIPVTIVLGVQSINNPTTYTVLGINEESDAALRIRRQQSVALASQGYLQSMQAAIANVTGVTGVIIYENTTGATDANGVPGHSLWIIVSGTGASASIANAIYTKRNAGCGLYGNTSYLITQVDGTQFQILWDIVQSQNLFIFFTATSIDGINNPNIAAIRSQLPAVYAPSLYQEVDITKLSYYVNQIDSNCLVTNAGFTTGGVQTWTLSGIAASGSFVITDGTNVTASIAWNATAATIQTQVRTLPYFSAAVVTGSIATQSLVITVNAVSVPALLYVVSNSLQTAGAVAITFAYSYNPQNVLVPTSRRYQFSLSSNNTVITALIMAPTILTISKGGYQQQFATVGGYGSYTYSFQSNASGGSINATSGLYTSGASSGTDVVLVTDALGNTDTTTVTVV